MDEVKTIQSSWFPSMMKGITPTNVAIKGEVGGMPSCVIRLAAALYKVVIEPHPSRGCLNGRL